MILFARLFVLAWALTLLRVSTAASKTNVVFVITDDLGWGNSDCYNRTILPVTSTLRLFSVGC